MASLKNRRDVWYARIRMVTDGRKTEKQIPLKTKSKVTARKRLELVNRDEDSIKKRVGVFLPLAK